MFEQHCSFKNNLVSRIMIQLQLIFHGNVFLSSQLEAILENGRHSRQGAVRRWLHPKFVHCILVYLCAKIGAFIKKCTIG